jgi:hypothetical protein
MSLKREHRLFQALLFAVVLLTGCTTPVTRLDSACRDEQGGGDTYAGRTVRQGTPRRNGDFDL